MSVVKSPGNEIGLADIYRWVEVQRLPEADVHRVVHVLPLTLFTLFFF